MDLNDLRSLVTLVSLGVFIAICVWAYSRRNQPGFDDAAALPFADKDEALADATNTPRRPA
jgi:cytochrome c oxidase cbb3-type subunit IV